MPQVVVELSEFEGNRALLYLINELSDKYGVEIKELDKMVEKLEKKGIRILRGKRGKKNCSVQDSINLLNLTRWDKVIVNYVVTPSGEIKKYLKVTEYGKERLRNYNSPLKEKISDMLKELFD